ncbi:hypothetical protein Lfu02_08420 [Longispora fulva]|uniref:Prevent-host-death family protein n=1 Tax=Longispora fulva TaxID=619741 RepID=A0A8J7KJB5_9ACTN|nr:hypothetical protein [Longispora fulva]MBG6135291.1 hypothetical protein [Longispora fulva]GIG56470.1 hypothetical protein Lfu02_08420 [Longispora fulva]
MAEIAARATGADEVGRALPLRDVRMRLPHLAALARAAGQVTVIVDDRTNQPLAALVPVGMARAARDTGTADQRAAALESRLAGAGRAADERVRVAEDRVRVVEERAAASSAGWARRCEALRADLRRQHGAEVAAVRRELARAWAELGRLSPPGADRDVDRLRAAQREFLSDAA